VSHLNAWHWSDIAYLTSYVLVIAGLVCLPHHPLPKATRTRTLIDALMIITAVAAFSWYFVLGPQVVRDSTYTPEELIRVAYPALDLALLFASLLLWARLRDSGIWRIALPLIAGVSVLIASDTSYYYEAVHGFAASSLLLDAGRLTGMALIALGVAAAYLSKAVAESSAQEVALMNLATPKMWRYLMPNALIPAVVVLLVCAARTDASGALQPGLYFVGAVLIELVFVHQFLAYRELISFSNKSARLESLATADPVTGLPNHRSVITTLNQEIEQCQRHGRSCTLLFLDLDHFKALNDTFGHQLGDAALREFASAVRLALRAGDTLGRWGGEEFVALLPSTEIDEALIVAERARSTVDSHAFRAVGGGRITCSIGLAGYPHHARDRGALLEVADQAMYAAKRLGRNRVCMVGDLPPYDADRSPRSRDDDALAGIVEALAILIEAADPAAGERGRAVSSLSRALAEALGMDPTKIRMLDLAGRLLDIGAVSMGAQLLQKSSPLLEDEWHAMRAHPNVSGEAVGRVPALRPLVPAIRGHHEHWDGAGYPDGLAGEAIPMSARILAVADAYIAMTSDRPFQKSRSKEAAIEELRSCAGTQFDPAVVQALEQVLGVPSSMNQLTMTS